MQLTINVSKDLMDDLNTVSRITGVPVEKMINEALYSTVLPYRSHGEDEESYDIFRVRARPALYVNDGSDYVDPLPHSENYERKVDEIPCWIIAKTKMFGAPYYTIVVKGNLMKVPEKLIKIPENAE